MNNPEDIFSHLPPADRPEPVKPSSLSNYDERERSMIQSALRVMLLMPVKDKTGVRTHYTDFDRASYIVAEAKKRGDSATHEDAIEALNRAGEPIVEQRQAELDVRRRTDQWEKAATEREGLSHEDLNDLSKLYTDNTQPNDILPEEPTKGDA